MIGGWDIALLLLVALSYFHELALGMVLDAHGGAPCRAIPPQRGALGGTPWYGSPQRRHPRNVALSAAPARGRQRAGATIRVIIYLHFPSGGGLLPGANG